MSPAPSGSLVIQCIKLGDALEIRDGIIFKFYLGLPYVHCIVEFKVTDWLVQKIEYTLFEKVVILTL